MSTTEQRARAVIVTRLKWVIRSLEGIIADKEWWNKNRPEAEPFDLGWERVMLATAKAELDAWARNDLAEVNRMAKKLRELACQIRDEQP